MGRPSANAYASSRWVAFQSDETGRNEIYIRPFPGPGSQVQISQEGGRHPNWQGREIFYSRQDDSGSIIEAATVELAPSPRVVSTSVALRVPQFADFDVTSDGRRFLLLVGKPIQPRQLNLTLNWPSELRGSQ